MVDDYNPKLDQERLFDNKEDAEAHAKKLNEERERGV